MNPMTPMAMIRTNMPIVAASYRDACGLLVTCLEQVKI